MTSTTLTSAQRDNVRTFVAAVNGGADDAAILSGWLTVAAIVAENGRDARPVVESFAPMPGKSKGSQNNAWTAVHWAARSLELVDSTDSAEGAAAVMTEFNYRASTGDLPGVATTVKGLLKAGDRFKDVAALAAHLRAERVAVEKKEKKQEDYAAFIARMVTGITSGAAKFDRDLADVLDDVLAALDDAAEGAESAAA